MSLLKPSFPVDLPLNVGFFTFHYVSIKTISEKMGFMSVLALHSTMSLLKPGGSRHSDESEENFTFHYVSIKTGENYAELEHTYFFTFHYVSIKTISQIKKCNCDCSLHSTMSLLKRRQGTLCFFITSTLYIPLCLY